MAWGLLALSCSGMATSSESENETIRRAKSVDVSTMDARLPAAPLDAWFEGVVGPEFGPPNWITTACGSARRQTSETPLCVRVEARRRLSTATVISAAEIEVGTIGGVRIKPRAFRVETWRLGAGQPFDIIPLPEAPKREEQFDSSEDLSALAGLLRKALANASRLKSP